MQMLRVTYRCKPGCRTAFVQALREEEIAAFTRREEGNLEYAFSLPLEDENTVCLLELWENKEALKPHIRQPKFLRLQELKAQYVEDVEIKRFEVNAL